MAVFKKLVRSASGAKVPHNKNTENCETVKMPVPKRVSVAMSMHIGAPAVACVKKGTEVKVGDVIQVSEKSRSTTRFKAIAEGETASTVTPKWLEKDENLLGGKVVAAPQREDIDYPVEEHLIVELYSK